MGQELDSLIAEARDPSTSFGRLWILSEYPDKEVRRSVIDNFNLCPLDKHGVLETTLLSKLATEFPEEVANHPIFVLHALVEPNDDMVWVVKEIVQRVGDMYILELLWNNWRNSTMWNIRESFGKNPCSSQEMLRILSNYEDEWLVRRAVASNPKTSIDILRILGNEVFEKTWEVRRAVAENPNTPLDVLHVLGNHKTEQNMFVRIAVANNPYTQEETIRILGNSVTEPEWRVRSKVARNARTPIDIIFNLGNPNNEPDWNVRHALTENTNTPLDILRTLSSATTEPNESVRESAKTAIIQRGWR